MFADLTRLFGRVRRTRNAVAMAASACLVMSGIGCATQTHTETSLSAGATVELSALCQPEAMQAVASGLADGVRVRAIDDGPALPGGVRLVPAAGDLPAYCQVTGSYVTNPATGKTANFLATFPADWNGKYLQIGCSGLCGTMVVSDPATPVVTISTQGLPGDVIRRGYAAFTTDEGHSGMSSDARWAIDAQGRFNDDAADDYYYRATEVLSRMGKDFTRAFYAQASGAQARIAHSYFAGCSNGGRDALVAAARFPDAFDGIISGSPAASMPGIGLQMAGVELARTRSPDATLTAALLQRVDAAVKAQCDGLDGVTDGLIQNPAACNFRPERDLPRCSAGAQGEQCFTQAQIETLSTAITAVTDERGEVLQPAFSISELQAGIAPPIAPRPGAHPLDTSLAYGTVRVLGYRNDPNFSWEAALSLRSGGAGAISEFRVVVPRAGYDRVTQAARTGIAFPDDADRMIRSNRKLLIWENLSDQTLASYMALNYYNRLAEQHGGFDALQRNARLFAIPGSTHCSITGVGPNSFDALGAMEAWVERGEAPNALTATLYTPIQSPMMNAMPSYDYHAAPVRTMPLCAYPAMARFSGSGDINDASNWSCPAGDRSMLTLGESGRRAGAYVYDRR